MQHQHLQIDATQRCDNWLMTLNGVKYSTFHLFEKTVNKYIVNKTWIL
jgi:hypothetical protein